MSEYCTIQDTTESLFKEKGSKFIGIAYPVNSEDEIKHKLEEVRKDYYDARHHCYAWVLGLDEQKIRANDDGEPSHSAGDPILGQIRSNELTNILVVVVRYFGGTKLGVGGLIHAYKTAASEALINAKKKILFEKRGVSFSFEYPQMSIVERLILDFGIEVDERNFQESCSISGTIRKDNIPSFLIATKENYNIKILIEK